MFCTKCGAENDAEANFCYKCGTALTAGNASKVPGPRNSDTVDSTGEKWRHTPPTVTPISDTVVSTGDEWRHLPPTVAPISEPAHSRRSRRPLRAGEVLIGLGAIALVGAGFAFLRSVWSDLGTAGQIAVLLTVVLVQAAASTFSVPRIRILGESLAASSAITLLLTTLWGYEHLGWSDGFFSVLMYALAGAHALILLAPASNRARVWVYTASVFVVVAGFSLLTTPYPYLFALTATAGLLLLARFAFAAYAERFAALHAVLTVFHVLVWKDGFYDRYTLTGLTALVILVGSMLWKTSYQTKLEIPPLLQTLRGVVWTSAITALGIVGLYGVFDGDPGYRERLAITLIGLIAATMVYRVPPPEVAKYRNIFAAGAVTLSLAQLGRDSVLVPIVNFFIRLGDGGLLLGFGIIMLMISIWRSWLGPAFIGAAVAALGWYVLLYTQFEDTFSGWPSPETFTIPVSFALLGAGFVAIRPQFLSSLSFLPGVFIALVPSALTTLEADGGNIRFTVLVSVCIICLFTGFRFRLYALVIPPGGTLLVLFLYRAFGFLGNSWVTLAIAAIVLLVVGSLFEKMRDRIQAGRAYLSGLR